MHGTWEKTTTHNSSALKARCNVATAQRARERVEKGEQRGLQSLKLPRTHSASGCQPVLRAIHTSAPWSLHWPRLPTPFQHTRFPGPEKASTTMRTLLPNKIFFLLWWKKKQSITLHLPSQPFLSVQFSKVNFTFLCNTSPELFTLQNRNSLPIKH